MFSVVIPLYNKEKYIARTIRSVLEQTVQDFEIIVVDDGSTDNSVDEVKKFDDDRIRIVHQENAGVSAARNLGIEEAQYGLVAFLDADDEWLPNHLEEIVRLKDEFPQCDVFATNYKIIDPKGNERLPVNTSKLNLSGEMDILSDYFSAAIKTAPPLCTITITVNKESLQNVGGFPVGVSLGEDLLTWAKLACRYKIAYSKKITAIYNFRSIEELSGPPRRAPDSNDVVGNKLSLLLTSCQNKSLRKYIALWHKMRMHTYIRMNDRLNSIKEMKKIIFFNYKDKKSYFLFLLICIPYPLRQYVLFLKNKLD